MDELFGCPLTLSGWHVPAAHGGPCACGWQPSRAVINLLRAQEHQIAAGMLRAQLSKGA